MVYSLGRLAAADSVPSYRRRQSGSYRPVITRTAEEAAIVAPDLLGELRIWSAASGATLRRQAITSMRMSTTIAANSVNQSPGIGLGDSDGAVGYWNPAAEEEGFTKEQMETKLGGDICARC